MSIGQALAAARKAAGLSVSQVSESTRLREAVVRAIEADDFSRSGGDFYARAQIKTLALTVGVDPAPLLEQFEAAHPREARPVVPVLRSGPAGRRERRGPNWTAAMAGALALIVVYAVVQLLSGGRDARTTTTLDSPTTPTAAARPTPTPTPTATATTPRPVAPSASPTSSPRQVTVHIRAEGGVSWVTARDGSGDSLYRGNLREGQSRTFTDPRRVGLTIGNAGAVLLTVNGKELGAPGKEGEVVRVTFTRNDVVAG